jgi:hypothetical protein
MRFATKISVLLFAGLLASTSHATLITNGFTFSVASSANTSIGTHYHSNTGGAFGNPAGKAEVGRFSVEEVRGLSEYDISGLGSQASAFVTFNVFKEGGLFTGVNDFPFDGTITVEAYQGNNQEDISDYQATSVGTVGSFSTTGLGVGDILSFDILSILNDAIDNNWVSLGMRLRADPLNTDGGAWTFDNFRLTTTDDSTVPAPPALALLGLGLAGIGFQRRRQGNAA